MREGAERVRAIVRELKALSSTRRDRISAVDVHRALDVAAATARHETRLRARVVTAYGPVRFGAGERGGARPGLREPAGQRGAGDPRGRREQERDPHLHARRSEEDRRGDYGHGRRHRAGGSSRIFEPFFTTKADGVGTGLGLSISHNIVTSYGGTLAAERVSPRGTLFRVTLRPSSEATLPHPEPPPPARAAAPRARVLLVDDEPATARVLAQILSRHDVTIAGSGREAIARLAPGACFDVIVCDLQMNDGSGVDVYEHLLESAPLLARRIIFMTGGAFTERARVFLEACPQPLLDKPFDPARLEALIDEMARSELPGSAAPRRSD